MKLAVVGSRNYKDKSRVYHEINQLRKRFPTIDTIVSGGETTGVDKIAKEYATEFRLKYKEYLANWQDFSDPCLRKTSDYGEYNALAGFKRNTNVVDNCDKLLAIHVANSPGTADTVKKAIISNKLTKHIKL